MNDVNLFVNVFYYVKWSDVLFSLVEETLVCSY